MKESDRKMLAHLEELAAREYAPDDELVCNRGDCGHRGTVADFQYAAAYTFPKMYHSVACPKCGTTDTSYERLEWFERGELDRLRKLAEDDR